jgi:excisionase family DNA binding protein
VSVASIAARSSTPARPGGLLTAEDVADRWQVPTSHVYRLAREGQLPCVRLGRYRRFRLAELEEFEEAGGTP